MTPFSNKLTGDIASGTQRSVPQKHDSALTGEEVRLAEAAVSKFVTFESDANMDND